MIKNIVQDANVVNILNIVRVGPPEYNSLLVYFFCLTNHDTIICLCILFWLTIRHSQNKTKV